MRNALIVVGIGAIILMLGWWIAQKNTETATNPHRDEPKAIMHSKEESPHEPAMPDQGASIGNENAVEFSCKDGFSIAAVFTRDIVALTLSDGRQLTLREAPNASGIHYFNNTQTIEFRGDALRATFIENGVTTYQDCKAAQ